MGRAKEKFFTWVPFVYTSFLVYKTSVVYTTGKEGSI